MLSTDDSHFSASCASKRRSVSCLSTPGSDVQRQSLFFRNLESSCIAFFAIAASDSFTPKIKQQSAPRRCYRCLKTRQSESSTFR